MRPTDLTDLTALAHYRLERRLSWPALAREMSRVTGVTVPYSTLYYLCNRRPATTHPTERTLAPIQKYLRKQRDLDRRRKAERRRRPAPAPAVL